MNYFRTMAVAAFATAAGSVASAATTPVYVTTYPLYVDAAQELYSIQSGVSLNPWTGTAATANGFTPSDFGGTAFQQGQYVAGSTDAAAGWSGSVKLNLYEIGYRGGGFQFAFDANEPGGQADIGLSRIQIQIDGVMIWDFNPFAAATIAASATAISLNNQGACASCAVTNNGLGSGADMGLYIPIDLVAAVGGDGTFSGASVMTFRWAQTNSSAGSDQWNILTSTIGTRYSPTDYIYGTPPPPPPTATPIPAAAPLLAAGVLSLAGLARRQCRTEAARDA